MLPAQLAPFQKVLTEWPPVVTVIQVVKLALLLALMAALVVQRQRWCLLITLESARRFVLLVSTALRMMVGADNAVIAMLTAILAMSVQMETASLAPRDSRCSIAVNV
jgi:hypothetical protein